MAAEFSLLDYISLVHNDEMVGDRLRKLYVLLYKKNGDSHFLVKSSNCFLNLLSNVGLDPFGWLI